MANEIKFEKSSGNIFKDLEFNEPEEHFRKARIATVLYKIIDKQKLTQKQTASILKINQSAVSDLQNGQFDNFTIAQLFSWEVCTSKQ